MVFYRPIQIKYSITSNNIPTLLPGELAFTQAGNNLFIGSPDGQSGNIRIAHKLHDGVLTANEALVANSTGGIDRVVTSNLSSVYVNASNLVSNTINAFYGVYTNLVSNNIISNTIFTSNIVSSDIISNTATFTSAEIQVINVGSGVFNSVQSQSINAVSGILAEIQSQTITVDDISSNNIVSNNGEFFYFRTAAANTDSLSANIATINTINTTSITVNSVSVNSGINTTTLDSQYITSDNLDSTNINVRHINANSSYGGPGYILTSSGPDSNVYWADFSSFFQNANSGIVDANTINTVVINANVVNTNTVNTNSIDLTHIVANGSSGEVGYILTSGGPDGNTYWAEVKAPYYVTTQMYDYTEYGLGWMNIAPNQNAETLGFRSDVTIPYGAMWILAVNDGLTDPQPITIYSPSTRTTPMMWMTIDKSGPYDPDTNPNGQDYWFNITPPPSGV